MPLEESGDSDHRARGQFIRAQIELETMSEEEDGRAESLREQSVQLFEEHWLAWWTPVAAAVACRRRTGRAGGFATASAASAARAAAAQGLALHHYRRRHDHPSRGVRPVVRLRRRLSRNGPHPQFRGARGRAALEHHWGDHIPLARLVFESYLDAAEWCSASTDRTSRLGDLAIEWPMPDAAELVALAEPRECHSPGRESGAIRSGRDPALHCTADVEQLADSALHRPPGRRRASMRGRDRLHVLEHLEELELGIGNPSFLGNPVFEAAGAIVRDRPGGGPSRGSRRGWAPFGPRRGTRGRGLDSPAAHSASHHRPRQRTSHPDQ